MGLFVLGVDVLSIRAYLPFDLQQHHKVPFSTIPHRPFNPANSVGQLCFLFIFLLAYLSDVVVVVVSYLRLLILIFFLLPPQSAIRLNENASKISQLKDDQEECETRLEKERDIYASNMFDLLAEEDNISSYIINYVKCESRLISHRVQLIY